MLHGMYSLNCSTIVVCNVSKNDLYGSVSALKNWKGNKFKQQMF